MPYINDGLTRLGQSLDQLLAGKQEQRHRLIFGAQPGERQARIFFLQRQGRSSDLYDQRSVFIEIVGRARQDHVHKVTFHSKEATGIALRTGREIFDSDLSLSRKRQGRDWIANIRKLASHAGDIGDQLAIFAIKRSI